MFGLNLKLIGALGLASLVAIGGAWWMGRAAGYELAELRCESRVQAVKDEVAERNAGIRDEAARRRAEIDRLLERKTEEGLAASEREREWRRRVEAYEAELRERAKLDPAKAVICSLTEEDVRALE